MPLQCALDQTSENSRNLISEARNEDYPSGINDTQGIITSKWPRGCRCHLHLDIHTHQQVQSWRHREGLQAQQEGCSLRPTCGTDPPSKDLWTELPKKEVSWLTCVGQPDHFIVGHPDHFVRSLTFSAQPPSGWEHVAERVCRPRISARRVPLSAAGLAERRQWRTRGDS